MQLLIIFKKVSNYTNNSPNQPKGQGRKNYSQKKESKQLWGVGKKIAQNIIDYGEAHGGFKAPEDIKLVDGIDDKKWNKWREGGWIIKIK